MLNGIVQPPDLVEPQDQSNERPIQGSDDIRYRLVNVTLISVKHEHDFVGPLYGTNRLLW